MWKCGLSKLNLRFFVNLTQDDFIQHSCRQPYDEKICFMHRTRVHIPAIKLFFSFRILKFYFGEVFFLNFVHPHRPAISHSVYRRLLTENRRIDRFRKRCHVRFVSTRIPAGHIDRYVKQLY